MLVRDFGGGSGQKEIRMSSLKRLLEIERFLVHLVLHDFFS